MESAVFALIGIIVGAILSGTVQIFIAWRERENNGRAACRILFAGTVTIKAGYNLAIKHAQWWDQPFDFDDWKAFRTTVAVVLSDDEFQVVAGSFYEAEIDEAARDSGFPFERRTKDPIEHMKSNLAVVEDAQKVLYWEGLTRRETRSKRKEGFTRPKVTPPPS